MKLANVVLSVLTIAAISADPQMDVLKRFAEIEEICKEKTGGTAVDMRLIEDLEIPQTRAGQCLAACVGKETGLMSHNKLDMVHMNRIKNVDPRLMKAKEACANVTDEDECDAARKIMKCVKQYI